MILTVLKELLRITVFLSRFGAFLKLELKFSKLLVQTPYYLVRCAQHKSNFSLLWTNSKCFAVSMQLIVHNCLLGFFFFFSYLHYQLLMSCQSKCIKLVLCWTVQSPRTSKNNFNCLSHCMQKSWPSSHKLSITYTDIYYIFLVNMP